MHLKTYRAPDLATALAKARSELGPDALVLATGETKGRLGLSLVEVTVGVPRRGSRPTLEDETIRRLAAEAGAAGRDRPAPASKPREPARPDASQPSEPPGRSHPTLQAAAKALVAAGLSCDLAHRFAALAARDLTARPDARSLARSAERGISELVRFAPIPVATRCVFVVGPPAAGKTTTVANLVARAAAVGDRPVFFAEADAERIGSLEQAAIYAKHLGARLAWIESRDDLKRALNDAGEGGTVVVDTPGIGTRDRDRAELVARLRGAVPDADVALVVPAGLHRSEASEAIERCAPFQLTCAGLSHLDEGHRPGEPVTAMVDSGLPMAFLTDGHEVPNGLHQASARSLATALLRAGQGPSSSVEGPA